MTQSERRSSAGTAVGALLFAAGLPFLAAEAAWEIVPEIGLFTEVDDNARNSRLDQESSTRTALDARLTMRTFNERTEALIEPRFITDAYADPGDKELENDDYFLLTRVARDFERSRVEFRSDYRRESILRSEIDSVLLEDTEIGGDPIDLGAGTLGTFTDERELFDLGLNFEVALSERTNLRVETSRIDVAYLGDQSVLRSDFDNTRAAIALGRLVDERNEVRASIYASNFHSVRNDNDTHAVGVEASFLRPLTETWAFEVDFGIARTDSTLIGDAGQVISDVNSGFTYGFQFDRRAEATAWTFGASRSLNPNSDGFLARRDDLRVQLRHRFTPRLTLSTGVRAARIGRTIDSSSGNAREYVRGSLELEWSMTERWLLITGVDSVTENHQLATEDATSNAVYLGVRYRGLSRE